MQPPLRRSRTAQGVDVQLRAEASVAGSRRRAARARRSPCAREASRPSCAIVSRGNGNVPKSAERAAHVVRESGSFRERRASSSRRTHASKPQPRHQQGRAGRPRSSASARAAGSPRRGARLPRGIERQRARRARGGSSFRAGRRLKRQRARRRARWPLRSPCRRLPPPRRDRILAPRDALRPIDARRRAAACELSSTVAPALSPHRARPPHPRPDPQRLPAVRCRSDREDPTRRTSRQRPSAGVVNDAPADDRHDGASAERPSAERRS